MSLADRLIRGGSRIRNMGAKARGFAKTQAEAMDNAFGDQIGAAAGAARGALDQGVEHAGGFWGKVKSFFGEAKQSISGPENLDTPAFLRRGKTLDLTERTYADGADLSSAHRETRRENGLKIRRARLASEREARVGSQEYHDSFTKPTGGVKDKLNGMANNVADATGKFTKPFSQSMKDLGGATMGSFVKPMLPAMTGAIAGGVAGAAGNLLFPENFGVDAPFKSAMMGAAAGLGMRGIANFTKHAGVSLAKTPYLGKAVHGVNTVASSKVTMGAIAAGTMYGSMNANFTRPINGPGR